MLPEGQGQVAGHWERETEREGQTIQNDREWRRKKRRRKRERRGKKRGMKMAKLETGTAVGDMDRAFSCDREWVSLS